MIALPPNSDVTCPACGASRGIYAGPHISAADCAALHEKADFKHMHYSCLCTHNWIERIDERD